MEISILENQYMGNHTQEIPCELPSLPAAITKAASNQTYYTIRFLVDRERVLNAYRAYAYFRWVDDTLDGGNLTPMERITFLERQQVLMSAEVKKDTPCNLSAQEQMLIDLLQSDSSPESALQIYLQNMMKVMVFDTYRRGYPVTEAELTCYTYNLASAVTEAMHYFIGHQDAAPQTRERYRAVMGAHITHMLRDTYEDTAMGYYNIPREFLKEYGISPCDIASEGYRLWVIQRVKEARLCFRDGRRHLAQVQNLRCRAAGYAYMARFESVLDVIEREDYILRPHYSELKSLRTGVRMGLSILRWMIKSS